VEQAAAGSPVPISVFYRKISINVIKEGIISYLYRPKLIARQGVSIPGICHHGQHVLLQFFLALSHAK